MGKKVGDLAVRTHTGWLKKMTPKSENKNSDKNNLNTKGRLEVFFTANRF
jgi:hypothetical protein